MTSGFLFFMASHLLQSTLFAAFAAGLVFLLRKNQARVRYGIWLAASLKFLIPFSLIQRTSEQSSPTVFVVLLFVWAVGAFVVASVWAFRAYRTAQCVRRASLVDVGRELEALRRMEALTGARKLIELRLSGGSLEPGIFGSLRPVMILPAGIGCHLSKPQLESIIVHELSHVRRYDNLTASLHMIVGVLFWFHPLVWWLGSRLVDERERACDEDVLKVVAEPQEYAEGILRVCELYLKSPVLSVSGVTGSDLRKRIKSIVMQPTEN